MPRWRANLPKWVAMRMRGCGRVGTREASRSAEVRAGAQPPGPDPCCATRDLAASMDDACEGADHDVDDAVAVERGS